MAINYKIHMYGGSNAIKLEIKKAIVDYITKKTSRVRESIEQQIRERYMVGLMDEEEYRSLKGHGSESLRGHFGIEDVTNVDNVVYWLSRMAEVNQTKIVATDREIRTGLIVKLESTAHMIQAIKDNIFGVQITEKGEVLEWLQWLLLEGGKTIIKEYEVNFRPGKGRSGQAIMIKKKKGRWSVPDHFQGTKNNNWVTRTIAKISGDIDNIVISNFKHSI